MLTASMPVDKARPFRIIGAYLAAAAVVYVANLFPIPGVILMIMAGGLWVSLILNAMLIHLSGAAFTGRIPRAWLLMPIGAYSAWIGFLAMDQLNLSRQLQVTNRIDVSVPTDLDLVFDKGDPFAVTAKEFIVGGRVFAGDYEIQIIHPQHAKPDGCYSEVNHKAGEMNYGYIRISPDYDLPGTCAVSRVSSTPYPGLRFRKVVDVPLSSGKGFQVRYSLELDDGKGAVKPVGEFEFGAKLAMSRWPIFWFGCALNSGNASWDCSFALIKRLVYYGVSRRPDTLWDQVQAESLGALLSRPVRHSVQAFRR
jgi:hypothetical protein